MIQKLIDNYCRLLAHLAAGLLAVMVVLVFGNVVMRYVFNSGFTVSEELSRWLFVWLTFLGAVVALRKNAHLGTDMLITKLSPRAKRFCRVLSLALMLYCLYLLFLGAYEQSVINWQTTSPVMGVSMSWFYASGVVFAVLGGVILASDLMSQLTGRSRDAVQDATPESGFGLNGQPAEDSRQA